MFEFKQIDKFVQRSLYNRIDALNRSGEFTPLEPMSDGFNAMDFLTNSCWARVTSAIHGVDGDGKKKSELFRLSSAFKDGQPLNKPLASQDSLYTNNPDTTFRPHSGIQSINTTYKSNYGIQETTITWKFWDINKFQEYESALLKHGRTVFVEFGWSNNKEVDIKPDVINDEEEFLKSFKSTNLKIKRAGGDYYCTIGKITNFDYKINPNGGFDCTTTIVSIGADLFKSTIDENLNSKVTEIQDSNLKKLEDAYANSNFYFEKFMENLDSNIKLAVKNGDAGVYHNGEKGYCNWAWFEDIVLSSFFGFKTEKFIVTEDPSNPNKNVKTDAGELSTQILSRNLKYRVDGDGKIVGTDVENSLCRYGKYTFTINKDVILPGRIPGRIKVNGNNALRGDIGRLMKKKLGGTDAFKDYIHLFEDFEKINQRFPKFKHPDKDKGIIRNMVFSSDYLKHFFSSVNNLENAMNSFWGAVASLYGGYWNFEMVVDVNNTGKIGMVDRFETEGRVADNNPEVREDYTRDKAKAKAFSNDDEGAVDTFMFSNYGKHSLFKDFSVNVNLSSEMATMALYHSNKKLSTNPNSTTNKPEDKGAKILGELQNEAIRATQDGSDITPFEDILVHDVSNPFMKGEMQKYKTKVSNNPSAKDVLDAQSGDTKLEKVKPSQKVNFGDKNKSELDEELNNLRADEETANETSEPFDGLTSFDVDNPDKNGLIWNSNGTMIASYERTLLYFMNKTLLSDMEVDPIVPVEVSFSMPGIGGLDLFDMFAVDYLPETYRKYALFQIKSQEHTIDTTGWTTNITGIMRVDMQKLVKQKGKITEPEFKEVSGEEQVDFVQFTIDSEKDRDAEEN